MSWLAATLAQTALDPALNPPRGSFYEASSVAGDVDFVFWAITWLCVFFFVLIVGLMFWFMWKYRRVSHVAATGGLSHHTPLEVTWTVIPLILVIAIFWIGAKGYITLRTAPQGSYEIKVVGQKWFWTLHYPNGARASTPNDTMIVPVNQPVKLLMESQDVLHSFFIPAFRVKQDVVPGRITSLWFMATEVGEYDLFCAEYCGTQHSQMVGKVQVLPQDDFDAEIARRARWMDDIPDEELWWKAGPRIYGQCRACHSVDGSDGTAPTFRGMWARLEKGDEKFNDGTILADLMGTGKMFASPEDYVQRSIWYPLEKIVEGRTGAMPTFKGLLDDRARRAMLDYIKQLSHDPDNFNKDGSVKQSPQPVASEAKPAA